MGILIMIFWFALGIYTFFIMAPLYDKGLLDIIGLFLICVTGGAFLIFADIIIEIMGVFLLPNWEEMLEEEKDDNDI